MDVNWWERLRNTFFKHHSNRSTRCSHSTALCFMDTDPVVPRRCLPQRPRIGGWKKHAKGWWRGRAEWIIKRKHALVTMMLGSEFERISKWLSMAFAFFRHHVFFHTNASKLTFHQRGDTNLQCFLQQPKTFNRQQSLTLRAPSTRAILRRKPSKSFGAPEKGWSCSVDCSLCWVVGKIFIEYLHI